MNDANNAKIERVVPRICVTCTSCTKQRGRYQCSRYSQTFSNGEEFTSVCANWQQGVLLTETSVRTEKGEEPAWLADLRKSLIKEREMAKFYYDLHEESAKRKATDR